MGALELCPGTAYTPAVRKPTLRSFPLVVLLVLCCTACNRKPEVASVRTISANGPVAVSEVRFPCAAVGGVLRYRILLPKLPDGRRPPVLYLLHGSNSGPDDLMERSEVERLAAAEGLAVVIPDAKDSYYTNAKHRGNARWEDAVARDLMQDVQTRFSVLTGREHTGIAGISMGGYGAAKLALKYPELYGFTGILSGALDITRRPPSLRRCLQSWRIGAIFGLHRSARRDEDVFELLKNSHPLRRKGWFASCGKTDPFYDVNERYAAQLRRHGAELKLLTTPDGHSWQSWNAALPPMFHGAGACLR